MAGDPVYFLGIDGGGTGCRARVTDAVGTVLGTGVAGPATARFGLDAALSSVMQAADAALGAAGLSSQQTVIYAAAGLAGLSDESLQDFLLHPPFASFNIVSDMVTAFLGAHGGRDGGIVIIGTGSVAYGEIGDRWVRGGGRGFPVSDEGSGAWLGLEALRMAVRAEDGRCDQTPLLKELQDQFLGGFSGGSRKLADWMNTATPADYASLAPTITKYAAAGDAAGLELLQRAAIEIAGLMAQLVKHGVPRIALLGGLAPVIQPLLTTHMQSLLTPPKGDGVDGALRYAGLGVSPGGRC